MTALCREACGLGVRTAGFALPVFHFLVPKVMVLDRPALVDLARNHALQGAFGTDGTDVDVSERASDQEQRKCRTVSPVRG